MVQTLCRHCQTEIPYNTLVSHGYCETCWSAHEDGMLDLDGCHAEIRNGRIHHHDKYSAHPAQAVSSLTWPIVVNFAYRMGRKLALNRHKGDREGWLAESLEWLFARGIVEGGEIAALMTHPPEGRDENWAELLADECADQANLWMMLADKALHDYPRQKEGAS